MFLFWEGYKHHLAGLKMMILYSPSCFDDVQIPETKIHLANPGKNATIFAVIESDLMNSHYYPYHPWDWYIYIWLIFMVNVGK